ncbi:MAG: GNAT family N-acetyltransferase [Heteroscytonema crispum UTEX LB 1556]
MKVLHESEDLQDEIFDLNSLYEMAFMVAEAFIYSDPMAIVQGFYDEEFANYIKLLGSWAQREELTVIARDKHSDKVIGAIIAADFASVSPLNIENISDKFKPVFELLEELETRYKQGKDIRLGKYLHCYMLAVSPQRRGQKVAQNLIQACLKNGTSKGYTTAVTEAANSISQQVFTKCGFVARDEILYKQFTYEGVHVFASIDGHTGTILMDKTLV